CKVIYVLCELRKLLDKYPLDPSPIALRMYCHWALHIDLTNPGTTSSFLARVDEFVSNVLTGYGRNVVEENRMFREFVYLETFREQLRTLLRAYHLPTAVCDNDSHWSEFLTHYAGIIEDGSLSCEAKTQRFTYVKEVIFSKGRARPSDAFVPFDMVWDIVLVDGRNMSVEVHTAQFPDGTPMMIHGIRLPSATAP